MGADHGQGLCRASPLLNCLGHCTRYCRNSKGEEIIELDAENRQGMHDFVVVCDCVHCTHCLLNTRNIHNFMH